MRSLLEVMLVIQYPNKTTTASSKLLVSELILDSSGRLNKDAKRFLIELEGNYSNEASVVNELKDIYHELSKQVHFPDIPGTGFFCGGKMPLRAAMGISLVMLQKLNPAFKMYIRYCDEKFEETAILQHGKVKKVKESNDDNKNEP